MPLLVALSKPRPIVRIDLPRSTSPRRVSPLHADRNWQAERRPKPPLEKPSMRRSPPTTWYRVRFYRTAKTISYTIFFLAGKPSCRLSPIFPCRSFRSGCWKGNFENSPSETKLDRESAKTMIFHYSLCER